MPELVLRELEQGDERRFRRAIAEFHEVDPGWEFAFHFDASTEFSEYVERMRQWSRGEELPGTFVPTSYCVAVVGDEIVGRVSLRHTLSEFLLNYGGHVGYGVVPRFRRKGYAKQMLALSLPLAKTVGIDRLLVTCDDDNEGSIRTIEVNGGVLEDTRPLTQRGGAKRRYWIAL